MIHTQNKIQHPGCMTENQVTSLLNAMKNAGNDPTLLCNLEGCGMVSKLENKFAKLCDTRFALAVSSGTAAVHSALLACGIGQGDEVIVTSYSWAQSVSPVLFCGATPVFADIDPQTLNIDPASVADLITSKTKAILPVHIFGHPADMEKLQQIADDAGLALISDAAHALGAKLHNRPIGTWGDITCFSLSRGKLISGGEGGVMVTGSEKLYQKALGLTQHPKRVYREFGPEYYEGYSLNYRIHPLAALLAFSDFEEIEKIDQHRHDILDAFRAGLGKQNGLSFQKKVERSNPAAYGAPLIYDNDKDRIKLAAFAQNAGVPVRRGPIKMPLHLRLEYTNHVKVNTHKTHQKGACPSAEYHCEKKELWAFDPLDMDGISSDTAWNMGQKISKILQHNNV